MRHPIDQELGNKQSPAKYICIREINGQSYPIFSVRPFTNALDWVGHRTVGLWGELNRESYTHMCNSVTLRVQSAYCSSNADKIGVLFTEPSSNISFVSSLLTFVVCRQLYLISTDTLWRSYYCWACMGHELGLFLSSLLCFVNICRVFPQCWMVTLSFLPDSPWASWWNAAQ